MKDLIRELKERNLKPKNYSTDMNTAQSQAWDCLKDVEKQSLFLQLSEGKSSWEAGSILGVTHYKYIEIRERSQKFFRLFTDFFEIYGSIFRPDCPCDRQFMDYIEALIEHRASKKEAILSSGDSANLVPKVSNANIMRNMNILQDSDDNWDICSRKLIFEFDRWNNFRILPKILQQPSAFQRREQKREKSFLNKLLNNIPDYALERIRERFYYKVHNKPMYWVALISKDLYTDGYYLLKIRQKDSIVNEMTRLKLYVFEDRDDADTFGFLVTRFKDRTSNVKLSHSFWPEYRAIIKKALNYNGVNNIDKDTKKLDMAFDDKSRKPKRKKRHPQLSKGESRAKTEDFYKNF